MTFQTLGLAEIPAPEQKTETLSIDTLIRRLEAVYQTASGINVTADNCMESPTVHAIVTGISRRMATYPLHVLQKSRSQGRDKKEPLPNHPVQRLLDAPNDWQDASAYWLDATSTLLRYGRFPAWKARGITGPIRRLIPLDPCDIKLTQDVDWRVTVEWTRDGRPEEHPFSEFLYVRGPARDYLNGDSPVVDCRDAIALEIAAARFAGSFFGGGAMPGIVFEFMEGFAAFKTDEERKRFVEDFQNSYGRTNGRFKAMLMPKGIKMSDKGTIGFENDKAQVIESRLAQRNIIAGAWGIPPDVVGDLSHQTYNNAEQQSRNLILAVMLPFANMFESAMERDLLTVDDRRSGVIIRFNLEGALRGDYKSQQEALNIQRTAGIINGNEWREEIGKNPISKNDGGEEYWRQGPSGQSATPTPDTSAPPSDREPMMSPPRNGNS